LENIIKSIFSVIAVEGWILNLKLELLQNKIENNSKENSLDSLCFEIFKKEKNKRKMS